MFSAINSLSNNADQSYLERTPKWCSQSQQLAKKASIGLAVLAMSFSAFTLPARADQVLSRYVYTTANSPTGDLFSGTVDANGNILDSSGNIVGRLPSHSVTTIRTNGDGTKNVTIQKFNTDPVPTSVDSSTLFLTTLDQRVIDMRQTLSDDLARNLLTGSQFTDYSKQLENIIAYENACKVSDGYLAFNEALDVGRQLDTLNTVVAQTARGQAFTPVVYVDGTGSPRISVTTKKVITDNADGTKTIVTSTSTSDRPVVVPTTVTTTTVYNPQTLLSLLDSRRLEIDRLIANDLIYNKINAGQAVGFRSRLNDIGAQIANARISGYTSDDARVIAIARDLDNVNSQLNAVAQYPALQPITVVDRSGSTKIAVDSFGNVVAIDTVKPELFLTTLDARIHDLQRLLAKGQASGRLTPAQTSDFRAELDRLSALEIARKEGGLTYAEALPIAIQLDYLSTRMVTVMPNDSLPPLVAGSRFVLTSGQVVLLDDLMVRRADLEGRIAQSLASGRLTDGQAAGLRTQMDQIAAQESAMRAKGEPSFKEGRRLYSEFDKVASRLDGYIAHR